VVVEERSAPGMRALERGLVVLRSFTSAEEPVTISQMARETGFDRAVVRRILGALEALGYVGRRGSGFVLEPSVLELGYAYLSSDPLPRIVEPRLQALSRKVQESSSFGVLQRDRVVYLARAQIKRISGPTLVVGSVMEPHLTALGQMLLSDLADDDLAAFLHDSLLEPVTPHSITSEDALRAKLEVVRSQGWCLADQELEIGLLALAVPVRASDGHVVGAVNLTSHTSRVSSEEFVEKLLPELIGTVEVIQADLRHARF
jgi:IclR family pca regulon transcriptional regulator